MSSPEEALERTYGEPERGAAGRPTARDIEHWIDVYKELSDFTRELMDRADPGPLADQLRGRLEFYEERARWWARLGGRWDAGA
jgi:hypothetical protein